MSRTRQSVQPEAAITVRSLALKLPPGFRLAPHEHRWAQLIYATRGVMSVHTISGVWVVPPQRAVWVPPGAEHTLETNGSVALRTLYLRDGLAPSLPSSWCAVLQVSPLLREIIHQIFQLGFLYETVPTHVRLAGVLVDQLDITAEIPLDLRMPTDARARRVAEKILMEPDISTSLERLAGEAGASARTLERLFRRETDMTFGRWRQQVRLLRALRLLAEGESGSTVALDVGYESTSAFIAMFKRRLGKTPKRYYRTDSMRS